MFLSGLILAGFYGIAEHSESPRPVYLAGPHRATGVRSQALPSGQERKLPGRGRGARPTAAASSHPADGGVTLLQTSVLIRTQP